MVNHNANKFITFPISRCLCSLYIYHKINIGLSAYQSLSASQNVMGSKPTWDNSLCDEQIVVLNLGVLCACFLYVCSPQHRIQYTLNSSFAIEKESIKNIPTEHEKETRLRQYPSSLSNSFFI